MRRRYIVRLTEEERNICDETIGMLKGGSRKARRARILLQVDADGQGWADQQVADPILVSDEDRREPAPEARAGGLCPGAGREAARVATGPEAARWRAGGTGDRLAPRAAARRLRELVAAAVGAAGRRTGDRRIDQRRNRESDAERNGISGRKVQYWVIPPEADAEFAASMEEVLETYRRPYDAERPVVRMDEQSVQLVNETREPVLATADRPRRVDYECERAGTAAVFMFFAPPAGGREATARTSAGR